MRAQLSRQAAAHRKSIAIAYCGPVALKFRQKMEELVAVYPDAFLVSHKVLKGRVSQALNGVPGKQIQGEQRPVKWSLVSKHERRAHAVEVNIVKLYF